MIFPFCVEGLTDSLMHKKGRLQLMQTPLSSLHEHNIPGSVPRPGFIVSHSTLFSAELSTAKHHKDADMDCIYMKKYRQINKTGLYVVKQFFR